MDTSNEQRIRVCIIKWKRWQDIKVSSYEVCPKSSWTTLSKVLDNQISLKANALHDVQHQLNKCSKFYENCYSRFGITVSWADVGYAPRSTFTYCLTLTQNVTF